MGDNERSGEDRVEEQQADGFGAPAAIASPGRLNIPTDDHAIVRRTKSLAAATPIGELERNKARLDGAHWVCYDLTALAFAAIDQVALHMGISIGLGYDDALAYTAGQAARQRPASPTVEHEQVAQKVLDHLIGTEPFTIEYLDHASGGPVRRTHTFRILYEQWNADAEPYLRATEEAINVLVGGLDIDIASAQIAVEAQLKALIERGALHDAARFAELARYRTITYLEHVRTIIRDTRIDPDAHDWLTDVPAELTAALDHVAERITTEAELRGAVADRRDDLTDVSARAAVNELLATLGDCMARNAQLQDHLIDARQHLRDAQDARFSRRGTSQQRYHLHADLTISYLTAPPDAVSAAADPSTPSRGTSTRPATTWMELHPMTDMSAGAELGQLSGDAASYGRALAATGRTRIDKQTLLDTWAQVVPQLTGSHDRLARLSVALDDLADAGMLRLPAAASWDRDTRPPLPRFVTLIRERPTRPRPWRTHPWRAELGWAASAPTLTDAQYSALVAINTWLAEPDETVVPVRLRSAQLLGGEKALDALEGSAIWGPGKVTHALLRCVRLAPPLATVPVGDGPDVLVVENADPYWALADLLTGAATDIGLLAWGAGGGVEASILSLWQDAEPRTVWYAGDLDPEGVTIARKAASRAVNAGHTVHPHAGLWDALAALTPTAAGSHDWSRVDGSWLGPAWQTSIDVRSAGGRVAQERLGLDALAAALGID